MLRDFLFVRLDHSTGFDRLLIKFQAVLKEKMINNERSGELTSLYRSRELEFRFDSR